MHYNKPLESQMKRIHVFLDFDGTVTLQDANILIFKEFVDPEEYMEIENDWISERITLHEYFFRQFSHLHANIEEVKDYLVNHVIIDSYFHAFVKFCSDESLLMTIISEGFDIFIEAIL